MIYENAPNGFGQPQHRIALFKNKISVPAETLKTGKIQIERKTFLFTLQENARGRFLRITEDVNGRRNAIVIPATGLAEFQRALNESSSAGSESPGADGARE